MEGRVMSGLGLLLDVDFDKVLMRKVRRTPKTNGIVTRTHNTGNA